MQREENNSQKDSGHPYQTLECFISELDAVFEEDQTMDPLVTTYTFPQEYQQKAPEKTEERKLSHSHSVELGNPTSTLKSSPFKDHMPTNKFSRMNLGDNSFTKASIKYQPTDKGLGSTSYAGGSSKISPVKKEETNNSMDIFNDHDMESDIRSPKRRREEADEKKFRQKTSCLFNKYTVSEIPPFKSPEPSPSSSKSKNPSVSYAIPKRQAQQTSNPLLSQSPSRPSPPKASPSRPSPPKPAPSRPSPPKPTPSRPSPHLQATSSLYPLETISVKNVKYRVLSQVGAGGTSKVFCVLAKDNNTYAIKQISFKNADVRTYQMYLNEINLLQTLNDSDLIVKMYDYEINTSLNLIYLVMEFGEVDMACLMAKERQSSINLDFIRFYWKKMLQAVSVLHNARIIHSDLKPANFMIVKGELRLIDFGIANKISNDTTNVHRDHNMGTPNYISPEALSDPGGVPGSGRSTGIGRPSDVWSLGCILYQMVYGHTPFQHLNMWQKIQCIPNPSYPIRYPDIVKVEPLNPSEAPNPEIHIPVSEELRNLLNGCLQRNPKDRFTIEEILAHPFFSR
ncbi:kinase-like domain-containing protein [Phycomyces nitens]|nr:kinase-like domain-containing protein [Phycomyces nitens]